jgi:CheY-like chemotaxis protein
MNPETLTILLVEDNADHAELVRRTLDASGMPNRLFHVQDGEAALDYLHGCRDYADRQRFPRPHLVLLDLRLPRIDGLEVLKQIKSDPHLHTIPVVVLTTSDADRDMAQAYENHANSYLTKPVDFAKFSVLLKDLGYYWLAWNRHPC